MNACPIMKSLSVAIALFCMVFSSADPLFAAPPAISAPFPLQLTGEIVDTAKTIMPCTPLRIQYSIKNTIKIPESVGFLTIDIKAAGTGQSVFTRHLPITTGTNSFGIENVDFPPGDYTMLLKASARNKAYGISPASTLAEQALTVSAPILVKKISESIPSVLLWINRNGTAIQQVYTEKILKQAFEDNNIYYTTVDSAEDFTNQAMSGDFNIAVLFEPDELLDQSDWLKDRITRGQGLVIIGSENRTRMIAETFGFTFSDTLTTAGAMLQLTEDSGMELSGTVPLSGRILLPRKKDAKPAAILAGNKRPAILIDNEGKGRVIVMPFSLTRSALDLGSTSLYSLLLRSAVLSALPETDEQTGVSSVELLVSAPSGTVRAHVVETLPPGARVIRTNAEGTVKNNTILFDLIAGNEPQRLRYVCQLPAGNKTPAFTEVFYECNGKVESQGKSE